MKPLIKSVSFFMIALILTFSSFTEKLTYANDAEQNEETQSTEVTEEHIAEIDTTLKLNCSNCTLYYKKEKAYSSAKELTDYSTKLTLRVFNNKSSRVYYSSTNKKIAIVSEDGIVSPQGVGKCVIKVKVGKKTLKCNVKVVKMPTASTIRKKLTTKCKKEGNYIVITVNNKTMIPLYVTVNYSTYLSSGAKASSTFEDIVALPGKTSKKLIAISQDDVVGVEKDGIDVSIPGSGYKVLSSKLRAANYYLPMTTFEVNNADLYIDGVEKVSDWFSDYQLVRFTVVNNEPYSIRGNAFIVFYKDNKIVYSRELILCGAILKSFESGVTQESCTIDSFEYDNYKIIKNGFFQNIK